MTIAEMPSSKKDAPGQSHHYSFAAASDGRGGLDTSVSANDVIMQHLQSQVQKSLKHCSLSECRMLGKIPEPNVHSLTAASEVGPNFQ